MIFCNIAINMYMNKLVIVASAWHSGIVWFFFKRKIIITPFLKMRHQWQRDYLLQWQLPVMEEWLGFVDIVHRSYKMAMVMKCIKRAETKLQAHEIMHLFRFNPTFSSETEIIEKKIKIIRKIKSEEEQEIREIYQTLERFRNARCSSTKFKNVYRFMQWEYGIYCTITDIW